MAVMSKCNKQTHLRENVNIKNDVNLSGKEGEKNKCLVIICSQVLRLK